MAAAAPPPALLESISKCRNCKSRLIQPMILSCLHSCCSECVSSLLQDRPLGLLTREERKRPASLRVGTAHGAIVCPQCEKAATARGENSFIEALSQVFAPDENVPKCQICKSKGIERNATQVCLHCPPPSYCCNECAGWHKLFPAMKTHRQVTLSEFMENGSVHPVHPHEFPVATCACCSKSKAEVSCRGCVLSLCLKCGIARSCSKGGKHDIEDESVAVERYRNEIRQEMDIFKQNSDSMREQIQATETQLHGIKVNRKIAGLKQKKHHSSIHTEMSNQKEVLQELCENNSVEMVTALSQMTEARKANIRGEKSGQRALDFTPQHLVGAALTEIKMLPRPSHPLTPHGLVKTEITFVRPDTANDTANMEKRGIGSVICNKVIKSWPGCAQPYICCAVTLPSGDVIFEAADQAGLYMVDCSAGNRIKLHDGRTAGICYSCSDQKVYVPINLPSNMVSILSFDLTTFDGTSKPTTEVSVAGCTRCRGIAVSSSGQIALAAYSGKCVLIFDAQHQLVQKVSFKKVSGYGSVNLKDYKPIYLTFGTSDTDLYITMTRDETVGPKWAVVCLFIDYTPCTCNRQQVPGASSAMSTTKPLVRWVRELVRAHFVQYMNGAVYVYHSDSISVLDPTSGSSLMTIEPGGLVRGIRSLPSGVVEVISYRT